MSRINYDLKNRGVRLVSANDAWVKSKNGNFKLNPEYTFVGKVDMKMPNLILSTTQNKKPSYKGDVYDLNNHAKKEIVKYFYDDNGKRNAKTVAYFGIEKQTDKSNSKKGGK